MAHMFRIDFITNHVNGMVEAGKIIVVAESHEQAADLVCQQCNLPPSRTRCESTKIKPPLYQVENRQSYPEKKASTIRTQREPPLPVQRFFIEVTASNVSGHSEHQVLRKVGEELCARGMQTKLRHHLQMSVDCRTADDTTAPGSQTPMEKIEMYGQRNGRVQGGQVRGR
jgi:hypothetical protein